MQTGRRGIEPTYTVREPAQMPLQPIPVGHLRE